MPALSSHCEVAVVGAGPAGSAAAFFLAQSGVDVLLIDRAEFPRDKTCGDALTPRALGVLRRMGVLEQVAASGFKIHNIDVNFPDGTLVESPIPPSGDLPPYLIVVPRHHLDDLLRQWAVAAGARCMVSAEVTSVLRDGGQVRGVRATTPDGPMDVYARSTIMATGAATGLLQNADLLQAPPQFGLAARTYFEGMRGLSDTIEFHLETIPLPGYAWVFPVSPSVANVGVGYFGRRGRALRSSPRKVLEDFLAHPRLADRLVGARQMSPVKGYPMRFDFPTARVAYAGLVLIGEAAGLVNPLTGEGIDAALESAETGATVLSEAMRSNWTEHEIELRFAHALRGQFLRPFLRISHFRDIYVHRWVLNRVARACLRSDDFRSMMVQVCLGNVDPGQGLAPKRLAQLALA